MLPLTRMRALRLHDCMTGNFAVCVNHNIRVVLCHIHGQESHAQHPCSISSRSVLAYGAWRSLYSMAHSSVYIQSVAMAAFHAPHCK